MFKKNCDSVVICPYNRHHVVNKLKIQKHIDKCQKRHPDVKLATCLYNFTHKVKPEDMLQHYEICPQKTRVEAARYCEPADCIDSHDSEKDTGHNFNFPKTKPKTDENFYKPRKFSAASFIKDFEYKEKEFSKYDSDSDSDGSFQSDVVLRDSHKTRFPEDISEEDDMKPLPLPKSVSKAFTGIKEQHKKCSTRKFSPQTSCTKGFGRAKNTFTYTPARPTRKTDHLLPDVSHMNTGLPRKNEVPKFFTRIMGTSCSTSMVSSVFDDGTTLKSQDLIYDDDSDVEDEDDNDGFILKNFDKYVKI